MSDTFHTRIPTLPDADLRQYVEHPLEYKIEAVEAALVELGRRGQPISGDTWRQIHSDLEQRDAALKAGLTPWYGRLLGASPGTRMVRIRLITGTLLTAGLGSATILFLTAQPQAANPLGYEPEDTKKYLRALELYGGKANVLATEFMRWFDGLWHGRSLAFTVAWLTVSLALVFWFSATRLAADHHPTPPDDHGRDGNNA